MPLQVTVGRVGDRLVERGCTFRWHPNPELYLRALTVLRAAWRTRRHDADVGLGDRVIAQRMVAWFCEFTHTFLIRSYHSCWESATKTYSWLF